MVVVAGVNVATPKLSLEFATYSSGEWRVARKGAGLKPGLYEARMPFGREDWRLSE
jgi:hypothetical protein